MVNGPKVNKLYHVTLTPDERADLERLTRTGTAAAAKIRKARVLLLADESAGGPACSDAAVVAAVGVGKTTVCRVRERFVEEGVEAAVGRRPPARAYARRLDGRAEAHPVALACSEPPAGRAAWTMWLLADRMVLLGHADALCGETVRRTPQKTRSSRG